MIQYTTQNTSGKGNTCSYIMLHHTASGAGSVKGTISYFMNPASQVSAHYVIDESGQIYKFNTDEDVLWHAGKGEREGIKDEMNSHSIGIELVGPLPGFTDKQRESLKYVVDGLIDKHGIDKKKIIRHKDYAPGRKIDVDDALWSSVSPTFYEWKMGFFKSTEEKNTEKKAQADVVEREVSKLRSLTQSQDNRDCLHEFNEWIRKTY